MNSIADRIYKRIVGKGPGWVFTPADFLHVGSRDSIDQTLWRLEKRGKIRRLARGIYDYPRISPRFGSLSARLSDIIEAIARNTKGHFQVSEAYAANLLGLTTQVPAKPVFLTDGTPRIKRIGNQVIVFKRATPKKLAGAGRVSGLVLQALRYLGRDRVDDAVVTQLGESLGPEDKKTLLKDIDAAPVWMLKTISQIAGQA